MAVFGKKDKKGKKANWKRRLGITGAVIALLIWYGFQPLIGTQEYALCRVFVELQLKYPETLQVLAVKKFQQEQRVDYVYIGPYGERRIEVMACVFNIDPDTGLLTMRNATLNRVPVADEKVEGFNKGLPYIQTLDLYKNLPARWDGTYMGLKDD